MCSLEKLHLRLTIIIIISIFKHTTYRTVRNIADVDFQSVIADLWKISEFSSLAKVNGIFLCTVLGKHTPRFCLNLIIITRLHGMS